MELIEIDAHSPTNRHEQLNRLVEETFGFSFEHWRASGGWAADFTYYAIAEGD